MTTITPEEQAEFDRQHKIADAVFSQFLDGVPDDIDEVGVAFGLWVNLTQFLAASGWTGEELAKDVHHHAALATSEGGMN